MTAAPLRARHLAALALTSALMPLNSTMIAVALPAIAHDVGTDVSSLAQWLVTSYLLVGIVCQSPAGKVGDLIGHGRMLGIGQTVFALGSVTGFSSHTTPGLTLARVLMAAGGAVIVPSAMALVRLRLAPERRARALGAFGAIMGLSAAVGPILGGELTRRWGWPWVFAANAPILLVSMALARGAVSGDRSAARVRFDWIGSASLAASLAALVVAAKLRSGLGLGLAVGGALGLVGFFAWERRAPDPVVHPELFRERVFAAGASVVALQNFAMYALLFELPAYLAASASSSAAPHAGASSAGRTLFAMMGAMVVASPLGGRLAERFGARRIVTIGSSMSLAGMASLVFVTRVETLALVPSLVVFGLGLGLSTAPSQAASLGAIAATRSGMASAALATARYLGGLAGVAALGALLAGSDAATQHRAAIEIFCVPLGLAVVSSLGLPRRA